MKRKVNNGMLSTSGDSEYETPDPIYNDLNRLFHFSLDVCATPLNYKHPNFFSNPAWSRGNRTDWPLKDDGGRDGLQELWHPHRCWMNPPYTGVQAWVEKAWTESVLGATVVALLAWRSDTDWFFDNILGEARYVIPLKRRIRFWKNRDPKGAGDNPSFPSVIAVFTEYEQPQLATVHEIGGHRAKVITLK